ITQANSLLRTYVSCTRLDVREVQQCVIQEGANVIAPNCRNIHFKDDDVRREEVRSKVTVGADRILYSHSCYRPHLLAEDIVIKQRNIRGSGRHEKVDHTSGEASADEGKRLRRTRRRRGFQIDVQVL